MKPPMAQRRQSFRFRIPWLSVAPEPSLSRRPKDRSKSPPQSDTNVPIHKPSSKPSVITPVESPPGPTKTQEAPKTEPQNHSPPPHKTPSEVNIIFSTPKIQPQPQSPSNGAAKTQGAVKSEPQNQSPPPHPTPSTSVIIPDITNTQSKSPSPKVNIVSSSPKTQPELQHQPQSLSRPQSTSDGTEKVPRIVVAEEISHTALSSFEKEKKKIVVYEPMPQETELKANTPSQETLQPDGSKQEGSSEPSLPQVSKIEPPSQPHPLALEKTNDDKALKPNSEEKPSSSASHESKGAEPKMNSPLKTILKSQHENLSTQPVKIIGDEQRSTTRKTPLEIQPEEKGKVVEETSKVEKAKGTKGKALLEAQSKLLQSKEKQKVVQETTKEGKAKDTHTTTTSKKGGRETTERKIMFAASNPSGRDTRVMSSNPGIRNVSSISPETSTAAPSSSGEKTPLQKGLKDDISKFVHKLASVNPTQPIDENKKFSVITLAGENKGATMHIGSESTKKHDSIHIHRAYKTEPDKSPDGEENSEEEEDEESQNEMEQGELGKAYVNSNIQSINNSLMFHGSINERDPGVQVTLPRKPKDKPGPETHKTKFNTRRTENLDW